MSCDEELAAVSMYFSIFDSALQSFLFLFVCFFWFSTQCSGHLGSTLLLVVCTFQTTVAEQRLTTAQHIPLGSEMWWVQLAPCGGEESGC